MALITPFDYHTDETKHGSYQYLTLKELVNKFHLRKFDNDSHLKSTSRYQMLEYFKDGIREFNKSVINDVRAIEITVPENLYFALPHNYADWVRVSRVLYDEATESYRLKKLDVNPNMNIADGYLQDNDYEILFDEDGGVLMADTTNVYNKPYKKYAFDNSAKGGQMEKDTSKLSKYGEFVIDKRNGKIAFSSDLSDQEIVLEYQTDGLELDTYGEEEIKVPKGLVQVLFTWVYHACIEYKGTVSQSEKRRALDRHKTVLHQAKVNGLDLEFIKRALRKSSKNL